MFYDCTNRSIKNGQGFGLASVAGIGVRYVSKIGSAACGRIAIIPLIIGGRKYPCGSTCESDITTGILCKVKTRTTLRLN